MRPRSAPPRVARLTAQLARRRRSRPGGRPELAARRLRRRLRRPGLALRLVRSGGLRPPGAVHASVVRVLLRERVVATAASPPQGVRVVEVRTLRPLGHGALHAPGVAGGRRRPGLRVDRPHRSRRGLRAAGASRSLLRTRAVAVAVAVAREPAPPHTRVLVRSRVFREHRTISAPPAAAARCLPVARAIRWPGLAAPAAPRARADGVRTLRAVRARIERHRPARTGGARWRSGRGARSVPPLPVRARGPRPELQPAAPHARRAGEARAPAPLARLARGRGGRALVALPSVPRRTAPAAAAPRPRPAAGAAGAGGGAAALVDGRAVEEVERRLREVLGRELREAVDARLATHLRSASALSRRLSARVQQDLAERLVLEAERTAPGGRS